MHKITTTQDSRTCVRRKWALVKCENPAIDSLLIESGPGTPRTSSENAIGSAAIEFAQ